MSASRLLTCGAGVFVALTLSVSHSQAQAPQKKAKRPHVTAPEVSLKVQGHHPKPQDAAEKKIIDVLKGAFEHPSRGMGNVPPEDGRLLRMLTELIGANRVVELGTSNGYSALWFCLALRSTGGTLITHEMDPTRIAMARANFKRAGVEDLVTIVEGDAHKTIKNLSGPIDVLFLDAEKEGFTGYLKQLLPLVRKGGLILAHDSSGQAHMMEEYFKAIAENPNLETVFTDASYWGMAITRKRR